ncbi:MAG: hypothetical protein IPO58_19750 [Betaproteobacteria bacterium]|nr:hypothetical protein [Betaproteobacteria bacterium]
MNGSIVVERSQNCAADQSGASRPEAVVGEVRKQPLADAHRGASLVPVDSNSWANARGESANASGGADDSFLLLALRRN